MSLIINPVLLGLFSLLTLAALPANASTMAKLNAHVDANIIQSKTIIMGTDIGILISAEDTRLARTAIQAGFAEIQRIDNLLTDWRDSEFESINQNAGLTPTVVSTETFNLIRQAVRISKLSQGAFDISYAGVGALWDFKHPAPSIPNNEVISKALANVGYQKIVLNEIEQTVFLPHVGMRIGLGGIAKGYAVDRAVAVIKNMGFSNFAVNAGGDLTVKGNNQQKLWHIAIQHPRHKDQNIAILPISNGTVVTSGDSERFFEIEGKRYSHIIDPRSGYPANLCQSVTIIAKKAYLADALATGVFVLGPVKGLALIESLDHIEGMIVDINGQLHVSTGLKTNKSDKNIL